MGEGTGVVFNIKWRGLCRLMWLFVLFDLHRKSDIHTGSQPLWQSTNGVVLYVLSSFVLFSLSDHMNYSPGHISESLFLQNYSSKNIEIILKWLKKIFWAFIVSKKIILLFGKIYKLKNHFNHWITWLSWPFGSPDLRTAWLYSSQVKQITSP